MHGDRISPDLRNTLDELAEYGEGMTRLITRIFSDHGLIVCGWSARYDPALRALVEPSAAHVLETFWSLRSVPSDEAAVLIEARRGIPVQIEGADSFFERLQSQVEALAATYSADARTSVTVEEVKALIPRPDDRIRLHDLLIGEVDRAVARLGERSAEDSPWNGPPSHTSPAAEVAEARGVGADLAHGCSPCR